MNMKEEIILERIKSIIGDEYIGDDCAYLKDLGLIVSQDNLIEGVHFSLDYMSPYQLGYKSAMVNLSDIAASGGVCKYMTVGLSLPKDISAEFVEEFYNGLTDALDEVKIIGGDITGSDKIMISITAIGTDKDRRISSRGGAKTGQVIVTSGVHGSSAGGLELLKKGKIEPKELILAHIEPKAQSGFAQKIAENIDEDYAMMDSSDGLVDALYKIAVSGEKSLVVDFEKVLVSEVLKTTFPAGYKDMVLYGGEDYQIIATVSKEFAQKYNLPVIGYVSDKTENAPVKILNYDKQDKIITNLNDCFNHFSQ